MGIIESLIFIAQVNPTLFLGSVGALLIIMGYFSAPLWLVSCTLLASLAIMVIPSQLLLAAAIILGVLTFPIIRRSLISKPIMIILKKLQFLPTISATEKAAIDAGTVWVDGELFSGKPNFKRILDEPYPSLTKEEQAFLDGPTEILCNMINDWEINESMIIPDHVMNYLKKEGFLGLIIPKKYGGKAFSALANSAINLKLNTASGFVGICVGVPNSLGPAELLIHYGTQKQQDYYLPRLARGDELPCFALTEPTAGSDAGSIRAIGEVIKGDDKKLYIKLNFNKRYITLAPLCTLLGLAFKLEDPNNLLDQSASGITCALIPANSKGVTIKRHKPIGTAFPNGEIKGKDVIIPIENIIGEEQGIGRGWPMLVECLAAGRGITLPASATAVTKSMMRIAGAYSVARKQFGMSIGHFEGIQEPLSDITGWTYLLDATRVYTCGGIDAGAKPAVITAIAKYHFTETARKAVTHATDILAGAAVMTGPKNLVATAYAAQPVGITVEGANIMTRTLMIFGQGAIRCHPYALDLIVGMDTNDTKRFDQGLFKHTGHIIRNTLRAIFCSLTRGYLIPSPGNLATRRYYQKLSWASAMFAILSDIAMISLGGSLKRRGMLTGRFGDILSWMYMGTAVLRRFEAEGRRTEDIPYMKWAMEYSLMNVQKGFEEVTNSLGLLTKGPIAFLMRVNRLGQKPSDKLIYALSKMAQIPGTHRDRITSGMFLSKDPNHQGNILDQCLQLSADLAKEEAKLQKALRQKVLLRSDKNLYAKAVEKNILSKEGADKLKKLHKLQEEVIEVDVFSDKEFFGSKNMASVAKTFEKNLGKLKKNQKKHKST